MKLLKKLKKYFELSCYHKTPPKKELLSTNEALKVFGKMGAEHKSDVMMMMAVIEYEFGRDYHYTKEQMDAVKDAMARVMKFMHECGEEWKVYEAAQAKKANQ